VSPKNQPRNWPFHNAHQTNGGPENGKWTALDLRDHSIEYPLRDTHEEAELDCQLLAAEYLRQVNANPTVSPYRIELTQALENSLARA
jgi:hypothetical protein